MAVFQMNYGGSSATSSIIDVSFDAEFEGCPYRLVDMSGIDDDITGTVPSSLTVQTKTQRLNTRFKMSVTYNEIEYLGFIDIGTYYGYYTTSISVFIATLDITTKAGANVTARYEGDGTEYSGVADPKGKLELTVYRKGIYTIYGTCGDLTASLPDQDISTTETTYPITLLFVSAILDDNDWDIINTISQRGTATSYWAIGDTKTISFNTKVCTVEWKGSYDVFIMDFDHNAAIEGQGISFGAFKNTDGIDICLVDGDYGARNTLDDDAFHMNVNSSSDAVTWRYCRMRYKVLGSTNVDSLATAPTDTATHPVPKSLMAAFPEDLRSFMKPITKYTNNATSPTTIAIASSVTATTEYLPLLTPFEISGDVGDANVTEASYQTQYAYFANGNSAIKYKHYDTATKAQYWTRSVSASDIMQYCYCDTDGIPDGSKKCDYSLGVFVVFKI